MAIGVMRFKPLSMAQASPGYFGLQNLQQGLMQGLKMQQVAEQQKLAEQKAAQEAQLMPLQQQLMQAKIREQEAKTAGIPMQSNIKKMNYELGWAQKVMAANSQDPNFLKDPKNKQALALAQNIQNKYIPLLQGAYSGMPTQQPQAPVVPQFQTGDSQIPQAAVGQSVVGSSSGEYALAPEQEKAYELRRKAQEAEELAKIYPKEQVQSVRRFQTAQDALDKVKSEVSELMPYFKPGETFRRGVENYASDYGIPVREATQRINVVFNKTIPFIAKDLAPAFKTPTAEKAYARFEELVDPSAPAQPQQLLRNIEELQRILSSGAKSSLQTSQETISAAKKRFAETPEIVPRGPQSVQTQQYSPEYIDKLRARKAELSASRRGLFSRLFSGQDRRLVNA
jgi:hypothetical protein